MFLRPGKPIFIAAAFAIPIFVQPAFSSDLPTSLQSQIPACAQPCLAALVAKDFPSSVCPDSNDLDCLCSNYGVDGYTLGERAFGCLYSSDCPSKDRANATSIYAICGGEDNAVAPTQRTVVVTASPTSSPSSSGSSTSGIISSSAATSSGAAMASMTAAPSTGSGSAPTQAFPTSFPSQHSAASVKKGFALTEAEVAGIAVAAIALVVLVTSIVGCLLYMKMKNKGVDVEESRPFYQHRNISGSGSQFGTPHKDPRRGNGGVGILPLSRPTTAENPQARLDQDRTWPKYYSVTPNENVGIAQTTNTPYPLPPVPAMVHSQSTSPPRKLQRKHPRNSWSTVASSRKSADVAPIRVPVVNEPLPTAQPRAYIPVTPPDRPRALPKTPPTVPSVFNLPAMASQRKASAALPPAKPLHETPTRPQRNSVSRDALPSQIKVYDDSNPSRPTTAQQSEHLVPRPLQIVQPPQGAKQPQRRPQQIELSRPAYREMNRYQSPKMPGPGPRIVLNEPKSLKPQPLRIQIPGSSSEASLTSDFERRRQQSGQENQKPSGLSPKPTPSPKSALASANRNSPKTKKKTSFTIAQVSPSQLTRKPLSPYDDPSGTIRSSGIFPSLDSIQIQPLQNSNGREPAQRISKLKQRRSEAYRDSAASFTSFESLGSDDDITPPKEEDKRLSAVSERSPISGLKYPKVPRSSGQSVSRTPPSPGRTRSSTLESSPGQILHTPTSKRGYGVEDQLWRTEPTFGHNPTQHGTPPRQLEPVINHLMPNTPGGTSTISQPWTAQSWTTEGKASDQMSWNLTSPFGPMPKLTPERHGGDLYLKVG